jgi:hypothetical protein
MTPAVSDAVLPMRAALNVPEAPVSQAVQLIAEAERPLQLEFRR